MDKNNIKKQQDPYANIPDSVPLEGPGVSKQPINKQNFGIPAHELEEQRARMQRNVPPPQPKIEKKEAKPIELKVPINRFSVAWSVDETKIYLFDEVYDQNEVVIDFQGVTKKFDKDKKKELLENILEAL